MRVSRGASVTPSGSWLGVPALTASTCVAPWRVAAAAIACRQASTAWSDTPATAESGPGRDSCTEPLVNISKLTPRTPLWPQAARARTPPSVMKRTMFELLRTWSLWRRATRRALALREGTPGPPGRAPQPLRWNRSCLSDFAARCCIPEVTGPAAFFDSRADGANPLVTLATTARGLSGQGIIGGAIVPSPLRLPSGARLTALGRRYQRPNIPLITLDLVPLPVK